MAKQRASETVRKCPITGLALDYNGKGRPPVFHKSASAADRRKYRAGGK